MAATVPPCGPKTDRERKLIDDVNATLKKSFQGEVPT